MLTRLSVEYEGLRVFWYDLLGLEAILGEHSISKTVISKFGFQGTNLNLLFFNACLIFCVVFRTVGFYAERLIARITFDHRFS